MQNDLSQLLSDLEQTSDPVAEGMLIHETTYPRRSERYQELEFKGIKALEVETDSSLSSE